MFPLRWRIDYEDPPNNFLKLHVIFKALISDLNNESKSAATVACLLEHTDVDKCFLPDLPCPVVDHGRILSDTPAFIPNRDAFKVELICKEGSTDSWQFKFLSQFELQPSSIENKFPDRFRGCLGLRTFNFGAWEPFSFTKFFEGPVNKTPLGKTNPFTCSHTLPEIVVDLSSLSLSTKFTPKCNINSNSHENTHNYLETFLFLELCTSESQSADIWETLVNLEMKAAISSWNVCQAQLKTDCTLRTNQELFFCHSEKIKSLSPELRQLVERDNEQPDSNNSSMRINKDWTQYFSSPNSLQCFLKFVYYHKLILLETTATGLFDLLKFAHMFNIPVLEEAAKLWLLKSFSGEQDFDFHLGFEVYSFAKKVESLKQLQVSLRILLHDHATRNDTKNLLVEFGQNDVESLVEILLPFKHNSVANNSST